MAEKTDGLSRPLTLLIPKMGIASDGHLFWGKPMWQPLVGQGCRFGPESKWRKNPGESPVLRSSGWYTVAADSFPRCFWGTIFCNIVALWRFPPQKLNFMELHGTWKSSPGFHRNFQVPFVQLWGFLRFSQGLEILQNQLPNLYQPG